jgi:hypothetical protein
MAKPRPATQGEAATSQTAKFGMSRHSGFALDSAFGFRHYSDGRRSAFGILSSEF